MQEREGSTVTRVFLVRHGETEWSREDRFAGLSDVPLSTFGYQQAQLLAPRLEGEAIAAVYSSPLGRARETAGLLASPLNLRPTVVEALREIDFGDWEGRTRDEVLAEYAPLYAAWTRDPATVRTPHGETGYDVATRAVAAIKEIARAHMGESVLVVGHRTVNRIMLCQLLGIGLAGYRERLAQDLAALSCLDIDARARGHLLLLNDTTHLDQPRPAPAPQIDEPAAQEEAPTVEPRAGEGATTWLVPDGYLPTPLNDGHAYQSHEALCVLNTGSADAHLLFDFFFEDRPAITAVPVTVPAERTLHVRLDRPDHLNGTALPLDVPFATRIRSDARIVVQHSRLDTSQVNLTLMTTMAYPVPDAPQALDR